MPPSTGFESQYINAGELQNRGFDATLNVIALQNIRKQFYWTVALGMNHNRNKIRKISDYLRKMNEEQLKSKSAPLPVYQEGKSTTTYYAVRSLGIDPMTGNEVFLTRNGEKTFKWNSADKVPVGDTTPEDERHYQFVCQLARPLVYARFHLQVGRYRLQPNVG